MRCNWRRWLWGIIPIGILAWVAVQAERGRIEQELTQRATVALSQGGAGWAVARFEGRDAVLTGRAADDDEPVKASEAVLSAWGVRAVQNRAELIEKAESYFWTASRRNNRIRLGGYAPNQTTRRVILGVAKVNFPGFEVVDRMTLARGAPSADPWLAGVGFGLKQLAALKRGNVRIEGLGLSVSGEAEDVGSFRGVKTALASGLPKGMKLTSDQVTAPVVSPYTWAAQMDGTRVTLSGYYPAEPVRTELMAALKAQLASVSVIDKMEPGDGAPQGWATAAAVSVRQIAKLEDGSAELKDGALALSGTAKDDAAAEAIRSELRASLPQSIKFTDTIRSKAPPPPPPQAPSEKLVIKESAPSEKPAEKNAPASPPLAAAPQVPPAAAPQPPSPPAPSAPADPQAKAPQAAPEPPTPAPAPPPPRSAEPAAPAPTPQASAPPVPAAPPPSAAEPSPPPAATPPPQRQAELAQPQLPRVESPAEAKARVCQTSLTSVANAGRILFRLNSADLRAGSFETLNKVAEAAKTCPDLRIEVGGHASSEGSAALNQQLSVRRARTVAAYLVRAGVKASQLRPVGYGTSQPVAPNDSDDNMAKNRRIEFTVRTN
jgi:outer membrane protein OmpA-like peptidoglycan-associated protein